MRCPVCKQNTVLFHFQSNRLQCMNCNLFSKNADMYLAIDFADKKLRWVVRCTQGENGAKIYFLQRAGKYFGTMTDYLAGIIHLADYAGDKEGLKELSGALYRVFGVHTILVGSELVNYYP